ARLGNRREVMICCSSVKHCYSVPTVGLPSFSKQFVPFCSLHQDSDACASRGQSHPENGVDLAGSAILGSNKEAWDASPRMSAFLETLFPPESHRHSRVSPSGTPVGQDLADG